MANRDDLKDSRGQVDFAEAGKAWARLLESQEAADQLPQLEEKGRLATKACQARVRAGEVNADVSVFSTLSA